MRHHVDVALIDCVLVFFFGCFGFCVVFFFLFVSLLFPVSSDKLVCATPRGESERERVRERDVPVNFSLNK